MASSSSISSPGIGSGLDVSAIVSKMMELEQRPLDLLKTKATGIESKISSYGQIKSAMAALYDAAKGLTDLATWRGKQFTTGNKDVVTGSATSAATAASFSLQVNALAQAQSMASGSIASGATMGADGQITLQKGRWDDSGTGFTANGSDSIQISISASDTLADVAAKITNSGSGLTAVVLKSASGDRLLVRGSETGQDNGFSMSVQGGGALGGAGMTTTTQAQDAAFTINGIDVTSASNTVADVVPGVTLNLLKTNDAPVEISVGADKDAIKTKVEAFQQAFNKINTMLADLGKYDASSKTAGALQGDSTVRTLQSALRGLVSQMADNGMRLPDLGLDVKYDTATGRSTMALDATKLSAALNDLPRLEEALTASGTGLMTRIRDFAFAANGVDGDITTRTNGLNTTKKRNESAMDDMETRLEQRQANLLKQYQALDAKMATMSSLSSFITSQVSQWNKS